ncbi:MAG: membrane protein of unknown function [Candidatus Nitrospira kreftii]|uniref:O-antigen ligase-related domain-containing protein n=1 Tax=Candidatus Nitrospira kreftii TaxID=2652173 RepID=A0A7S8FEY2_9BACT|nr:MAG: membrane protein of unknown function [Candidatus Nitrospira kreftii]
MSANASLIQSGVLALFVSIPLFRPVLLAHNQIYSVYAIFVLGFLVLLANITVVKWANLRQLFLLCAYTGISVVASLFATQDIRVDYLGLLCFLVISYLLGVWLGKAGSTHCFFRVAALIFLPIACYVVYHLSKNSFSYHTYYHWSSAAYKIDYLTTSLYAVVLLIYFSFNGRNALERYALTAFCFSFVAISGARYSIISAACVGIYMMLRAAKISAMRTVTGCLAFLLVLTAWVLFNESLIAQLWDAIDHSVFRLEKLFGDDTSVAGRMVLMGKAGKVIFENFSFGVGLAGSGDALGKYPHNILLEAFVDGGLFAMLLLLLFLVYSVYALIKVDHEHKVWCVLLVGFLIGAFLKSFSLYEARILFVFIGYAATLITREVPA